MALERRYCKDCSHCVKEVVPVGHDDFGTILVCDAHRWETTEIDVVTGKDVIVKHGSQYNCESERNMDVDRGGKMSCGPTGRNWEPRPTFREWLKDILSKLWPPGES